MLKRGKKGQITLFIIIAVIIVAVIVFFLLLRGRVTMPGIGKEAEPKSFIEDCVKQYLKSLSLQVEFKCNEHIKCYQHGQENIPYLCYGEEAGKDCTEYHPEQLLEGLKNSIKGNVSLCINQSLNEMKNRGYITKRCSEEELEVKYRPTSETICVEINCLVSLEKEKTTSYESFEATVPSTGQVSWGAYDIFKEAVQAIVGNESKGDLTYPAKVYEIVEQLSPGTSLTTEHGSAGSWITIFVLEKDNLQFKFAIKEVE